MATTRRRGSPNGFWNNAAVLANGVSAAQQAGRDIDNMLIVVTVDAATTITVEVGHMGGASTEGVGVNTTPTVWYGLSYLNEKLHIDFTAAGSQAMLIPDFEPDWVRLRSTGAATITAGFEASGD